MLNLQHVLINTANKLLKLEKKRIKITGKIITAELEARETLLEKQGIIAAQKRIAATAEAEASSRKKSGARILTDERRRTGGQVLELAAAKASGFENDRIQKIKLRHDLENKLLQLEDEAQKLRLKGKFIDDVHAEFFKKEIQRTKLIHTLRLADLKIQKDALNIEKRKRDQLTKITEEIRKQRDAQRTTKSIRDQIESRLPQEMQIRLQGRRSLQELKNSGKEADSVEFKAQKFLVALQLQDAMKKVSKSGQWTDFGSVWKDLQSAAVSPKESIDKEQLTALLGLLDGINKSVDVQEEILTESKKTQTAIAG